MSLFLVILTTRQISRTVIPEQMHSTSNSSIRFRLWQNVSQSNFLAALVPGSSRSLLITSWSSKISKPHSLSATTSDNECSFDAPLSCVDDPSTSTELDPFALLPDLRC